VNNRQNKYELTRKERELLKRILLSEERTKQLNVRFCESIFSRLKIPDLARNILHNRNHKDFEKILAYYFKLAKKILESTN